MTDYTATNIILKDSSGNYVIPYTEKQDPLTTAQLNAVNSGITSTKVGTYDGYATAIAGKQATLSQAQLNAANSGITSTKVSGYDSHLTNTTVHVTADDKTAWSGKQAALSTAQLAAANSGITSTKVSTYDGYATTIAGKMDKVTLATVATSGSYNDLSNKPSIPTITDTYSATSTNGMSGKAVASAISGKANSATTLSGYGITDAYTKTEVDNKVSAVYKYKGSVESVSALPTTGQVVGDVYNVEDTGMNYAWTGTEWDALSTVVDLSPYAKTADLKTVATSGSYNDLTNKPTIPTVTDTYSATSSNAMSGKAVASAISNKMDKVTLATVATSGSYNDLSNKPTIPSAVTETTVSGWGFTKNAGTITGATMNGSSVTTTNGVLALGTVITSHQSLDSCVKTSGNQTIAGTKTFSSTISGNISGSSGSCTGNAATATKATQDGSGNTITTYYQPKLTAGTNITITGNTISATGGGSSVSYDATTETLIFS